jgi:hypothetical protein
VRALLATTITGHRECEQDHSYLSHQHHVVLGFEEVNHLIRTITNELAGSGGLTIPILFFSLGCLAHDIN